MLQRAARYSAWLTGTKPVAPPPDIHDAASSTTDCTVQTAPASSKLADTDDRQQRIQALADAASRLGYEVVDVAGFLEALRDRSQSQTATLDKAQGSSRQVQRANDAVVKSVDEVTQAADHTLEMVGTSVVDVQESARRSSQVAGWVASISGQVQGVKSSLGQVDTNTKLIEDIAFQIDILSVNARIEASRAGEAGKGFAVIAHAINELSGRTNEAAKDISSSVRSLNDQIATLAEQSASVRGNAEQVISDNQKTDASLAQISTDILGVRDNAQKIGQEAQNVNLATSSFVPAFRSVGDSVTDTTKRIQGAMTRVEALIDKTEEIVQMSASLGGKVEDAQYIDRVVADAALLSKALEAAVENGQVTENELFSRSYVPVPRSDPAQVLAPFTKLTDQLFTPVQENALTLTDKVVFCAAVNCDGYLPTHNRKFSKPQGRDVAWNTANCRNRRIFDDRVGLKAGRNTEAFLLQVYRRDMGGGVFKLMKDVSAPIRVNGRHWGGLRLAFDV